MDEMSYNKSMDEGLKEYVKQEIAASANQYYDIGKFLFSVTTFLIVAILTIRSTLGEQYNYILFSLIVFAYSFFITLRLTVFTNYENSIEKSVLDNYYSKRKWMGSLLKHWGFSFVGGLIIFIVALAFSTYAKENTNSKSTKIEDTLVHINDTLKLIYEVISTPPDVIGLSEKGDFCKLEQAKVIETLETIKQMHYQLQDNFVENDKHLDRHLQIISKKISSSCLN